MAGLGEGNHPIYICGYILNRGVRYLCHGYFDYTWASQVSCVVTTVSIISPVGVKPKPRSRNNVA